MVVSSWEQVVESSERNNEEPWSFIQGISFPPQAPHSTTFKDHYPETCLWWAEEQTPRMLEALGFRAALLTKVWCGTSGASGIHLRLPLQCAAATDRSPGQQAPVWKETVHLGFPGVKWSPAAGATRRLHIWWWLTMLVFLWKPHSDWGACVWSCLP